MGLFANSRYLKQEDVGEEGWVLTIAGLTQENVARQNEKPEMKYIIHFAEPEVKPLALNVLNAKAIGRITGITDEDAIMAGAWNGFKILAYQDPNVVMAGEVVGGIRVKPVPSANPQPPRQPGQVVRTQAPQYQQPYQQPPTGYAQPPRGYQQPPPGGYPPPQATQPYQQPPAGRPPVNPAPAYQPPAGHQPSMDFDPGDGRPPGYVPPVPGSNHPGGPL